MQNLASSTTSTATRAWASDVPDDADDGSVHCLGNGLLCAYEEGPNITQIFGPPYSSPMLGSVTLAVADGVKVRSSRESGTAIWTHVLHTGDEGWAELVDFVDARLPCLVRRVRTRNTLRLAWKPACPALDNGARFGARVGGRLCEVPAGVPFYSRYPHPRPVVYQVAWRGPIAYDEAGEFSGANGHDGTGDARDARDVRQATGLWVCEPGESWLYFLGGPEYPNTIENTEAALALPGEDLLARTRAAWQDFTRSRHDWSARLPAQTPFREKVLRAVDDVSVLIKTQQSAEGGVLAGHNYHLCYVRDQYGVSRGLLKLGHVAEARAILEYYWRIWQRHGRIHNAQAAGVDGAFHVHENDEVEITGYLIRQAYDLLRATGDVDFVDGLFPMLAWAYEAQKRHLVAGMLPFNGDETYVAGGILPRTALNDGSAEATLLFIDSGTRLTGWAARIGHWAAEKLAEERALLKRVRDAYRDNFVAGGQLATNNPLRASLPGGSPRFRHGVCERCMAAGRFRAVGWTERSANGRYLCPECLARVASGVEDDTPVEPRRYFLRSVSLTPLYFQSDLLSTDELAPTAEAIVRNYQHTGRLPSRPDDVDAYKRNITVGYDYGFLLYALVELAHPGAHDIAEMTLALADPTGAWVEYYSEHRPAGTRYRPWESAINLEALLHWAVRSAGTP